MRIAIIFGAALLLAAPVLAQSPFVSAPPPQKPSAISGASSAAEVSPTLCAEHNKYLREKTIPALRAELVSLQRTVAERKAVTFMCDADGTASRTADGHTVIMCGSFRCNPIDGLCRTQAKNSAECAPGHTWLSPRDCVRTP